MRGLYALLAVVVVGGLVMIAWLALGVSICEYDCGDEETNLQIGLVVFIALVFGVLLAIKRQSRHQASR